jgi:hypothetical protein
VLPRKSIPSRAITPAKPMISPASCLRPGASALISHSASTAVNNGPVAVIGKRQVEQAVVGDLQASRAARPHSHVPSP